MITLFLFLNTSHRGTQDRWEVLSPSHKLIYLFNTSYVLFLTAEDSKRHPLEKLHWLESSSHRLDKWDIWLNAVLRRDVVFPPFPKGFWNKSAVLFLQHQLGQNLYLQHSASPYSPQPPPPTPSLPARFNFVSNTRFERIHNTLTTKGQLKRRCMGLVWFF